MTSEGPACDGNCTRWVKLTPDANLIPLKPAIVLLWCGNPEWLSSPRSFGTRIEADTYRDRNGTVAYMIVPDARKTL